MNQVRKILAVVDPTSERQVAMERAAWLAKNVGATLELFVCSYDEYLSGDRLLDAPSLAQARAAVLAAQEKLLQQFAEPLIADGVAVSTTVAWDHPLDEGIVRQATASKADIVFKDTHHHSVFESAFLSNIDWSLIRACPAPLWLVKQREIAAAPVFVAAIDPLNRHDKPAALDDEILQLGKTLASIVGGELHAFHSYDPRTAIATATANAYIPVSLPYDEIKSHMREEHSKRFDEITSFHHLATDNTHLVAGLAHEELPEFAEKIAASVVVMGAVARSSWKRLFIGATAERTLQHLPCDLLIVKPDWFRTPVDPANPEAA